MEDGSFKLFESGAMVNYIFKMAGKMPKDVEGRALLAQWRYATLNTVEITTLDILRYDTFWRDKPCYEWRRPESVEVGQVFDRAPHIMAYMNRCKARPAFQRALAMQGAGAKGGGLIGK